MTKLVILPLNPPMTNLVIGGAVSIALSVAGRVSFHLVEYKTPFAFMVTYTTKQESKISHLPLKHARTKYKKDTMCLEGKYDSRYIHRLLDDALHNIIAHHAGDIAKDIAISINHKCGGKGRDAIPKEQVATDIH